MTVEDFIDNWPSKGDQITSNSAVRLALALGQTEANLNNSGFLLSAASLRLAMEMCAYECAELLGQKPNIDGWREMPIGKLGKPLPLVKIQQLVLEWSNQLGERQLPKAAAALALAHEVITQEFMRYHERAKAVEAPVLH